MITPKLKDELLQHIVNSAPKMFVGVDLKLVAQQYETSPEVIDAIFWQFHEKKFISYRSFKGYTGHINVQASAHDYILKGGHLGEFEFLEMQVQKLKNELYQFESSIPAEQFKSLTSTLSLILTAATTYKSFQ